MNRSTALDSRRKFQGFLPHAEQKLQLKSQTNHCYLAYGEPWPPPSLVQCFRAMTWSDAYEMDTHRPTFFGRSWSRGGMMEMADGRMGLILSALCLRRTRLSKVSAVQIRGSIGDLLNSLE